MTREEAIKILERAEGYVGIHYINGVEDPYINPCLLKAIDLAISSLRDQEERRWIPVTERMPDDDKLVVCLFEYTDCPEYDILRWDNADYRWENGEEWFYHDEVTHWMPIPSTEGLK